jgi:phage FluMu gp28-like protein
MESVVLLANVKSSNARSKFVGWRKYERQVDVGSFAGSELVSHFQALNVSNHLIDGSKPQFSHDSSQLVSDVVEKVNDMLRRSCELLAEFRILSRDTDRAVGTKSQ